MPQTAQPAPAPRRWRVLFGIFASAVLMAGGFLVWYFRLRTTTRPFALGIYPAQVMALKVYTQDEGMYEIHRSDLIKAGLNEDQLNENEIQIFYRGLKQPLWIDRTNGEFTLRFYAQKGRSLYSSENIYWLVFDPGALAKLSWPPETNARSDNSNQDLESLPVKDIDQGSYYARYYQEQNLIYQPLVEGSDHWFWESLAAPGSSNHEITLESISKGQAFLRASFWSGTEAPVSPDHHISLSVNDIQVSDVDWDGMGDHIIEAVIPPGTLREGKNSIQISAPGVEGVIADIITLNWFEIIYPRLPYAIDDGLEFTSQGRQLVLSGFSGEVAIYDITNPDAPTQAAGPIGESKTGVTFTGERGHLYLAVSPQGYKKPSKVIPADLELDLTSPENGANYLLLSSPDFEAALQPLIGWRTKQGYQVRFIPVGAIFDQFNYGFPEPVAIQRFLINAKERWKLPPSYVLLVGDASYDPKGYLAPPEANRLPAFFIQTVYGGQTVSDVPYTAKGIIDNQVSSGTMELWPDLYVGRVPARNSEQVSNFVSKTIAYEEKQNHTGSTFNILAIADGQGDTFRDDAHSFLDQFPDKYKTKLYAPPQNVVGASKQIIEDINQGYFLIAYFGHGSINMWGKDRLFTTEDIPSLSNIEHLPVVINMTCLTGLFTHPKIESLAESLLWYPRGGAVAVLAPTSLTLPFDQSYLSHALVQNYLAHPDRTLGQILQEARMMMPIEDNNQSTRDVLMTFLLFGDPALRLAYP